MNMYNVQIFYCYLCPSRQTLKHCSDLELPLLGFDLTGPASHFRHYAEKLQGFSGPYLSPIPTIPSCILSTRLFIYEFVFCSTISKGRSVSEGYECRTPSIAQVRHAWPSRLVRSLPQQGRISHY